MYKSVVLFVLGCLAAASARCQSVKGYELERDLPVFLDTLKKELTYPMAWGNSPVREFGAWRTQARAAVLDAMLTPPPYPASFEAEVLAEEQRAGYRARKVRFNLSGYSRVNAYLLVPDGEGPFPAVVLLHDHGAHFSIGKEKMIRPFGVEPEVLVDADAWAAKYYDGQYVGDWLAAHGYVVIAVDALFWGERGRKEGIDPSAQSSVAGHFLMLGRCWSGYMSYEDMYTTEYLATLPQVDASRVGCMGFSMGAYRAWMLAALSDRIKAGVAVCWMTTTDCMLSWKYGRNEHGGFANLLPGIRRYLDYPHIASLACPKPMYFISGESDHLFPPIGVRAAFSTMHQVWSSQHAEDRLRTEFWDMPHHCGLKVQQAVLQFLDKWL